MEKLKIVGGTKLRGNVRISGAKNAAVAIIPAVLMVDGVCVIENVPHIKDVLVIADILSDLGAKVKWLQDDVLEIDATTVNNYIATDDKVRSMRASYYLLGALLGRFHMATVRLPGGCNFGERPIDQHIKSFEALRASVNIDYDIVIAKSEKRLKATHIYLDVVSVGATINAMLAACMAEGTTIIENVAKEPHVVDLANFLNTMGASVRGAGTDTIRIRGVEKLHGGTYSIIPDQIEAGTFMIAAAAAGGDVLVENIIPQHMDSLSAKLSESGAIVTEFEDSIRVESNGMLKGVNVKTRPYPGFPTDLQPQMVTLLSAARGKSMVTEGVWESRFQYIEELKRMGADIVIADNRAIIHGVDRLRGATVKATDLRAGACLAIAGIIAEGTTYILDLKHIDRGYQNFEEKLTSLGANVVRIDE
ncbi:MAG: UDP-N-acetylglucosamine 1-carboxyvinyltransferase [Clostridia bacterium]|nr:UDP-N-acetylglucosamine 1-carboxyvinyltransferase [Clostridia bacterium]